MRAHAICLNSHEKIKNLIPYLTHIKSYKNRFNDSFVSDRNKTKNKKKYFDDRFKKIKTHFNRLAVELKN